MCTYRMLHPVKSHFDVWRDQCGMLQLRIRLFFTSALDLQLIILHFLINSSHFFSFNTKSPHSVNPTVTKTENRANYYKLKQSLTDIFLTLYWQDPICGFHILSLHQRHQQARVRGDVWVVCCTFSFSCVLKTPIL